MIESVFTGRGCWLAVGALLVVMVWLATGNAAEAAPNSVGIEPAKATVAPGGSVTLDLVAEPPAAGLAAWVVNVVFDPSVIATESRKCDPLDTPAGSTGAIGCEAVDTGADGLSDVVKAFGAVIFSEGGGGLEERAVLAAITFGAVGSAGECSWLTVTAVDFRDPNSQPTNPLVSDGEICIEGLATPTLAPATPAATPPPTPEALPATGTTAADGAGLGRWELAVIIALGLALMGSGAWVASRLRRAGR